MKILKILLFISIVFSPLSYAQQRIFLRMDGIQGDVTVKGHEGEVDILSMGVGMGRAISSAVGTSADREASKPSISEMKLVKYVDATSPQLFLETAVGKGKLVTITVSRDGFDYLIIELHESMFAGFSISGFSSIERMTEDLSISFTKMLIKYIPMNKDGTSGEPISSGYDMALGTKI